LICFAAGVSFWSASQKLAEPPGTNVYVSLHLTRPNLRRGQRGGKNGTVAVVGLVADMDADTGKVGEMPVEPSYIIETSPGNTQAVILFDRATLPDDADQLAKAYSARSRLISALAAHVWRTPGTLNWPHEAKIARAQC
jgi:hypothetical protein